MGGLHGVAAFMRGDTAPKPAAPERKQKAAAEILDAGADKRLDKMRKAAKKAPPR